jgi:hypothetical protein
MAPSGIFAANTFKVVEPAGVSARIMHSDAAVGNDQKIKKVRP